MAIPRESHHISTLDTIYVVLYLIKFFKSNSVNTALVLHQVPRVFKLFTNTGSFAAAVCVCDVIDDLFSFK